MKTYIAGKISGLNFKEVARKFFEAEQMLLRTRKEIFNPYWHIRKIGWQHKSHEEIMKVCLDELSKCSEAYFLQCWEDSYGAKIEHQFCIDNKIKIVYEKES